MMKQLATILQAGASPAAMAGRNACDGLSAHPNTHLICFSIALHHFTFYMSPVQI